jgi:GNAT superfamily N-acetyltransferase
VAVTYEWRGHFNDLEVNQLHGQAFPIQVPHEGERNWVDLVHKYSLGWVVARDDAALVGFVNVIWDGLTHAWIQDTMVAQPARGRGVGTHLVEVARNQAAAAGCTWLHVDFGEDLKRFYIDSCGFAPTSAGLIALP